MLTGGKNLRLSNLIDTVNLARKKIKSLRREVDNLKEGKKEADTLLEVSEKRRLFAEANVSSDTQKLKEIIHLTDLWVKDIDKRTKKILHKLHNSEAELDRKNIMNEMQSIQLLCSKIAKLSKIITKASFGLMSDKRRFDIFSYISEYISEIQSVGQHITKVDIDYKNSESVELQLNNLSFVEVSMLVDNIIINAEKHKATKLHVIVTETGSTISLTFTDNGIGLTNQYPPEILFEAGITTTEGSGIGLYQVKQIAEKLNSNVSILNNKSKGATVILEWKK